MRNSGFRKLSYTEALLKVRTKAKRAKTSPKRKVNKKVSKVSVSKLHKLAWQECRRVANIIFPKNCYTCPKKDLVGSDCQLGHGQSKGSLPLMYKYDMRNLRWQCFHCNINLQGCQQIFLSKLEKEKDGLAFLNDSSYKDENGGWRIKKMDPINARDFLTGHINSLKTLG